MHRARALNTNMNNDIGQMAIAIALLGSNDIGRSVTPTFLFRNSIYLQLFPHDPKMKQKKINVERQKKKNTISVREISNPAIMRLHDA